LQYEHEGDEFLYNNVTGEKSWMHQFGPENKIESWNTTASINTKDFQNHTFC
jgi:hypothetical protein